MLLDTLAVTPSANATSHIPGLLELFKTTLGDAESLGVRVWTIRALGKLAEYIEVGEDAEIVRASFVLRSALTAPL